MPTPVTVSLAGCGRWGRHILRDLVALGCRVTVAARDEASRAAARAGGAWRVVESVADLPESDGAVVATPSVSHAEVASRLLERSRAVFVEKPLTPDPASARALAAAAPGRVFVMHKWRYHPGVEALATLAHSGELGRPVALHTTRIDLGHPHTDVDAIWILAPHDLSIALEVLGQLPEPLAASAEIVAGRAVGMSALLTVPDGGPTHHLEVSALSPVLRREVRLHCEGGSAVLAGSFEDCVRIVRVDGSREERPATGEMPLLRELKAFVAHLTGGPPPRSDVFEGVAVVETIGRLRRLAGLPEGVS